MLNKGLFGSISLLQTEHLSVPEMALSQPQLPLIFLPIKMTPRDMSATMLIKKIKTKRNVSITTLYLNLKTFINICKTSLDDWLNLKALKWN